jgi:glycosyltransferase involved in cell wall biosynthesis
MVSFIVPTMGRGTLKVALDSVLAQSDPDWEVIVVSDGLVEQDLITKVECSGVDPRIKYRHLPRKFGGGYPVHNGRAGLVRNEAFSFAHGIWFAFLDDDDILDKDYVKWLKEEGHETEIVIFRMVNSNGAILPPVGDDRIVSGLVGISFAVQNWFIQKNAIRFENHEEEDFMFLSTCICKGARLKISGHVAYYVKGAVTVT